MNDYEKLIIRIVISMHGRVWKHGRRDIHRVKEFL